MLAELLFFHWLELVFFHWFSPQLTSFVCKRTVGNAFGWRASSAPPQPVRRSAFSFCCFCDFGDFG
jgi:hypothetical protein